MFFRFWRAENRFANFMATLLVLGAIGAFGVMDDPQPVGADPIASRPIAATILPILPSFSAPAPLPLAPSPASSGKSVETVAAPTAASPAPAVDPHKLTGRWAMQVSMMLMQQGMEKFSQVPYYRAKFFKQELVKGTLLEGQEIDLKMGHSPFSVYMKFRSGDKGRQAIYVDGQHDNQLLVQPGGVAGRLSGTLKFPINADLVMAENRYPVTQVGLVELARTITAKQIEDLNRNSPFYCELSDDASFEDRPCYKLLVGFSVPVADREYRKAEILIDKELKMPICVRNFGWGPKGEPVPDEESLIEHYAYSEIEATDALSSNDFDPKNKKYYMRMK